MGCTAWLGISACRGRIPRHGAPCPAAWHDRVLAPGGDRAGVCARTAVSRGTRVHLVRAHAYGRAAVGACPTCAWRLDWLPAPCRRRLGSRAVVRGRGECRRDGSDPPGAGTVAADPPTWSPDAGADVLVGARRGARVRVVAGTARRARQIQPAVPGLDR